MELIIVSSNFQALLLLSLAGQITGIGLKAINSSKKVLKITAPALFRINSVIISARTVNVKNGHVGHLSWLWGGPFSGGGGGPQWHFCARSGVSHSWLRVPLESPPHSLRLWPAGCDLGSADHHKCKGGLGSQRVEARWD